MGGMTSMKRRLALLVVVPLGVLLIAGIWLRWAAKPVIISYKVGREVERLSGRQEEAQPRGQRLSA